MCMFQTPQWAYLFIFMFSIDNYSFCVSNETTTATHSGRCNGCSFVIHIYIYINSDGALKARFRFRFQPRKVRNKSHVSLTMCLFIHSRICANMRSFLHVNRRYLSSVMFSLQCPNSLPDPQLMNCPAESAEANQLSQSNGRRSYALQLERGFKHWESFRALRSAFILATYCVDERSYHQ